MRHESKSFSLITALVLLAVMRLSADADVGMNLNSSFMTRHTLADETYFSEDEWAYGGSSALGLTITPLFSFEENFQMDSKIDLTVAKDYLSPDLAVSIAEIMIDLLFFERFGFQTGFLKMDYGFQSYFHPLSVTNLLPEFADLFGKISIGGTDRGFKGIPGFGADITVPEIIPGLSLNLRQRVALFDFDADDPPAQAFRHFERNYFISDLRGSAGDIAFGVLAGFSGNFSMHGLIRNRITRRCTNAVRCTGRIFPPFCRSS